MANDAVVKTLFKSLIPQAASGTPYEYTFCIDKPSTATVKIRHFKNAPVINISKGRSWISLSVHEFESLVENADEFREKIEECRDAIDPNLAEEMHYSVISSSSKRKSKNEVLKKKKKKVSEVTKSRSDVEEEDE